MKKITIVIIEDHTLIRETWGFILDNHPQYSVMAQSGEAEEGIELCRTLNPDIVMLDINLPGMNGLQAVPLIREFAPTTKIVGVSMHNQPDYAKKMIQNGAAGYVTKNSSHDEMLKALMEVHKGKKYICDEIKNALAREMLHGEEVEGGLDKLSLREIEMIRLIREGMSSKEIALTASISVKTVEVHRYNILRKLGLKNAPALVNYINKNAFGLI